MLKAIEACWAEEEAVRPSAAAVVEILSGRDPTRLVSMSPSSFGTGSSNNPSFNAGSAVEMDDLSTTV